MTAPARPFIDPTELTPTQWQQYLTNAMGALRANPRDREALQAVRDANQALGVYDEAQAATPGERIRAGITGGLSGLGEAALDVPRGVTGTVLHPIQTLENLPGLPQAMERGLTSNDPAQVARTVGNIGALAIPLAKAGRLAPALRSFREGATTPLRTLRALAQRPGLNNELLRLRIARMANKLPASTSEEAGATAEELAVAKKLNLPVSTIRGRVGTAALKQGVNEPRATTLPIRGDVSAGATGSAAPDALRTALLEQMSHPMAHTPPFEQSAAAPGVIEAQASRAMRRALATPGPISTRIVRSDLAGELPERRPFSGAPEGGVQQVAYPGRSPVDIPLDPGLAETMLGPVGEPGKGEPLLSQRGVLERPLPVAPGEFPERPVVGEPGALIQNRFNAATPLSRLGKGKTLPYYPRGGRIEQALPPAPVRSAPQALRNTPYADLRTALADPKIPLALRQAIRQELGRRGIAGFP